MLGHLTIKLLGLLLVLHTLSPLCHAFNKSLLAPHHPNIIATHAPAPAIPHPAPTVTHTQPDQPCWFQSAHLFKAPALHASPSTFTPSIIGILAAAIVVAVNPLIRTTRRPRKPPDRSPPSQPLLQIFRI